MVKPIPPPSVSDGWPAPNFISPHTRGKTLPVVGSLSVFLVTITLAGRVWVRWQIRRMGADDWLIVAAYIPAIALYADTMYSLRVGWDRHIWDQRLEWHDDSELVSWQVQLSYTLTMALAKMSILTSFLRIIPYGRIRIVIWCTLALVTAWGIGLTFATIFSCYPVRLYWTSYDGVGCSDETPRLLVTSVVSIATDVLVVTIPIVAFARLRLPVRQKIVLICLLSMGVIATVASICRTVLLAYAVEAYDITWHGYDVFIMTDLECNLALVCACVPALRPLFGRWVRGLGEPPTLSTIPYSSPGTTVTTTTTRTRTRTRTGRSLRKKSRMIPRSAPDPALSRIHETVEFEVRISEDATHRSASMSDADLNLQAQRVKSCVWIEELSRAHVKPGRHTVL